MHLNIIFKYQMYISEFWLRLENFKWHFNKFNTINRFMFHSPILEGEAERVF